MRQNLQYILFSNFFIPVFWKIKAFAVTKDSDSPVDFRIILLVYDNPRNYNCSSIILNGDMCSYPRSMCPAVTGKKLATSMLEWSRQMTILDVATPNAGAGAKPLGIEF